MARPEGFEFSHCGARSGAALTAHRAVIHSRAPFKSLRMRKKKQKRHLAASFLFFLARPEGFEPPSFRIGICCDIQLRHGRILFIAFQSSFERRLPFIIAPFPKEIHLFLKNHSDFSSVSPQIRSAACRASSTAALLSLPTGSFSKTSATCERIQRPGVIRIE